MSDAVRSARHVACRSVILWHLSPPNRHRPYLSLVRLWSDAHFQLEIQLEISTWKSQISNRRFGIWIPLFFSRMELDRLSQGSFKLKIENSSWRASWRENRINGWHMSPWGPSWEIWERFFPWELGFLNRFDSMNLDLSRFWEFWELLCQSSVYQVTFNLIMVSTWTQLEIGSSTVEEEHQTWYFLCATLYCLLTLISLFNLNFQVEKLSREKSRRNFACGIGLMTSHRILRSWNQTGNKFLGNPDIAKFLISNHFQLEILGILSLGILGTLGVVSILRNRSIPRKFIPAGICLLGTLGTLVFKFDSIFNLKDVWIARLVYFSGIFNVIYGIFVGTNSSQTFNLNILGIFQILMLIHRPENFFLFVIIGNLQVEFNLKIHFWIFIEIRRFVNFQLEIIELKSIKIQVENLNLKSFPNVGDEENSRKFQRRVDFNFHLEVDGTICIFCIWKFQQSRHHRHQWSLHG